MNAPLKPGDLSQKGDVCDDPKPHVPPSAAKGGALVTVITSANPTVLTKQFSLERGALKKEGGGILVSGNASVREVADLADFATLLLSLGPNQALTYGVPLERQTPLVTEAEWGRRGKPGDIIPRTKEHFFWPGGRGIMMVDYDPEEGMPPLDAAKLHDAVLSAAPGLKDAAMLTWPSASTFIKNSETGDVLRGAGGLRLYLMVEDAADIERAGKVLSERLWLAGHCYVKISSAGSLLPRTLVDGAVWQSNRLDFAAGAQCSGPLVQDRGEPQLIGGATAVVDIKVALPDLTPHERKLVIHLQEEAREEKKEEAAEMRNSWLDERARKNAGPDASAEEISQAKLQAETALDKRRLSGAYIIEVEIGGRIEEVTVEAILADPERFNGLKTRDPIEPDYDHGRIVGMLFLDGATKTLHSFARGGSTFRLTRDLKDVLIPKGKLAEAVDATVAILREQDTLFDRGDELVLLDAGRLHPLSEHSLNQLFGGIIQYYGVDRDGNRSDRDPPPNIAKRVLQMQARRNLKPLTAVITAPTLRLDGTILDTPGYDVATGLFFYAPPGTPTWTIPEAPTVGECRRALDVLWFSFQDFPFVDAVDRGVMLSALLTATVRAILSTAPAFGFDAPVQGSGKSLLASCVAALAGEASPSVYAHTRDEDEIRKRILTVLRSGASAIVWDNVLGEFDSAALAALLTSPSYTDRVLGVSQSATLPNRALFTITGNNLVLKGDMTRRVLVARIDPHTDTPHARAFNLDPLQYVKDHRFELTAAAITLIRGWLSSGAKPANGRMASFEAWNDLVRNTVAWIGQEVSPGTYEDPMAAVTRALENDPDLDALSEVLAALEDNFGHATFSSQDVMARVAKFKDPATRRASPHGNAEFRLYEALITLNERAVNTTASLGKTLKFRKDRMVEGRVLRQSEDKHSKTSRWRVSEVER